MLLEHQNTKTITLPPTGKGKNLICINKDIINLQLFINWVG
jgi:hypothetical protein